MNNKLDFKKLFIKKYQCLLITFLMMLFGQITFSQEMEIGIEYLKAKEFEKAKTVFGKLAKNKEKAQQIHTYYLQTLTELKNWDEAEKFVKKQIKNNKTNSSYYVDLGEILLQKDKTEEGKQNFIKAIEIAQNSENEAQKLANYFYNLKNTDYAIATLQATRLSLGNPLLFSNSLGKLYKATGKTAEMLNEYLIFSEKEGNLDQFKAIIQDEIKTDKDLQLLEKILYEKVQKFPDSPFYIEALISHLVNQKLFFKAFLQAKALDKRMKYEGSNVYELAFQARQNKDYLNAAKMFEYMAKEYPKNPEYPAVRRMLISCKEEAIKNVYPIDSQEIRNLIKEYDKLIEEVGLNTRTIEAMKNKANLLAFYLDDKEAAIIVLQKAIKLGANDPNFVSRCKLDLGDIELLNGDFWEATLTYQQVEKAENDNPIGYDSKLRNAKLNYYKGDFDLASDILDILKKATTREIANDAMALSLLIKDNTGEDSTEVAMKCYAAADLLIFQNKVAQAIDSLTKIIVKYDKNNLVDDALYLRATCFLKQNKIENAVEDYKTIIEKFGTDVLGDDSMFQLATIYDEKLKEKDKAMQLYQDLMKNYPGSIYVVEARNKFRVLRGDIIN